MDLGRYLVRSTCARGCVSRFPCSGRGHSMRSFDAHNHVAIQRLFKGRCQV